jgi:hypothetical protein
MAPHVLSLCLGSRCSRQTAAATSWCMRVRPLLRARSRYSCMVAHSTSFCSPLRTLTTKNVCRARLSRSLLPNAGQFLASLPYTVVTAFIYQGLFHYIVGFNDAFESYVYAAVLTIALL